MQPCDTPSWSSFRIAARILLVDDASDNRHILSYFLARAGADVVVAEDGRQALELFDAAAATNATFDAIVTDMEMPDIDGYELTQRLRLRGETLPIVACTASARQADMLRCLEAGCTSHVSKPIMAADLILAIAAALDARASNEACLV